jgi:hypothetical protein
MASDARAGVVCMTPEQLQILQHALGLDEYGRGEMYRNHFCAGDDDEPICRALVEMGYMRVFRPNAPPYPYYNCTVTEAGKEAVRRESPEPPKLTRAQRRYRRFLEADSDLSFMEWLRWYA